MNNQENIKINGHIDNLQIGVLQIKKKAGLGIVSKPNSLVLFGEINLHPNINLVFAYLSGTARHLVVSLQCSGSRRIN